MTVAARETVLITALDAAGRGVGRGQEDPAAQRWRAPGALPGEIIEVEAAAPAAKPSAPRVAERWRLLEPAPERVAPPCAHAGLCGACSLQHAALGFTAAWKRGRIERALAAAGLEAPVAETRVSPLSSRRRVKLAAHRGKKGVRLGYFERGAHRVAPIESCLIAHPAISAALPALRDLAALAAPRARPIALWVEATEGGLDVMAEAAKPLDLPLREQGAAWAEDADVARLSWNGETLAARRPALRRHGSALVAAPAGAFRQATEAGETALVAIARRALTGARRVADLFAGAGTFALPLAEEAEVLAVEGDSALVSALDRAWRETPGLKRLEAVRRDLFRRPLLPEELASVDGAVFDPPRAGAEAQTEALAAAPPSLGRIVGVSCEPESFARDAAILARGGWRLAEVTPIDQFLFSAHVELIGVFERRSEP
ncbi:MAG: class I SAM-dependent RNA methyltransferase [Pseudomonadota bacterium]